MHANVYEGLNTQKTYMKAWMLKNLHGGLNVRKYVWRLKHLKNDMEAEMGETEYGSLNPRNYIWWLKCS